MKNIKDSKIFIISRTDSIGDVVLTMPMAGIIKKNIPDSYIIFIGNSYTKPVLSLCKYIDKIVIKEDIVHNKTLLSSFNADVIFHVSPDVEIAKLAFFAHIPYRVGTSHRWFHWIYINKKINFSRIQSTQHESLLNLKLLKPILPTIENILLDDIPFFYGFNTNEKIAKSEKFKVILHPKSKGSAKEWPLKNYLELVRLLPVHNFEIYITGTESEYKKIHLECPQIFENEHVINVCNSFTLNQFITFIGQADALIACSTGPLHIAAASGIHAIGLYPSSKNMHPRRWGALGKNVKLFYPNFICKGCTTAPHCACMENLKPGQIADYLKSLAPF